MRIKLLILMLMILLFTTPMHVTAANNKQSTIEINLLNRELTFIQENEVIVFPISIGTELSPTPIGEFHIIEKSKSWGGGFGSRWLGLDVSWGTYGIHGTNRPYLIGENISSGCIRMHNHDVETLYEMVPIGTNVIIKGPITGTGKGDFKNISKGSKGNLVQLIQNRLTVMSLYTGTIDGIFGVKTELALKAFQKQQNITVNGVVSYREYLLLGLLE